MKHTFKITEQDSFGNPTKVERAISITEKEFYEAWDWAWKTDNRKNHLTVKDAIIHRLGFKKD